MFAIDREGQMVVTKGFEVFELIKIIFEPTRTNLGPTQLPQSLGLKSVLIEERPAEVMLAKREVCRYDLPLDPL